jgi:fatty-acyl-CoA synthase
VLVDRAASDPHRLAYDHGGRRLTFGQLAERAAARGGALQRLGVSRGDRVALVMSAGIPFAEVFWALQLIGGVPCAFNPAAPAQALATRVEGVRPRFAITDATAAEMGSASLRDVSIGPEDLAFLQPTSGTSGAPRAAMIRQRNVLACLHAAMREKARVERDDVLVSWVPPWHDLGLVRFLVGAVYYGAECHIVDPAIRTIPDWLRTISRSGGTISAAPDFCYRLATRVVDPASVDLSSLRSTINGGEPVRRSSVEQFEDRFGVPNVVAPGYGLAEATLGVTSHDHGEEIVVDHRGNVSCGTALPGMEVRAGRSADAPEEILVRGAFVFAGYADAPEETSRALRDGWLHTGDSGYLDAGRRLFVLGRRSGMIKRAGSTIAPRELEEAAQKADGVRVAAAVSVASGPAGDDSITVVVEADVSVARSEDMQAEVLRQIVGSAGFAPGRVAVVAPRAIPRTLNGKIRHDRLRTALLDGTIG